MLHAGAAAHFPPSGILSLQYQPSIFWSASIQHGGYVGCTAGAKKKATHPVRKQAEGEKKNLPL